MSETRKIQRAMKSCALSAILVVTAVVALTSACNTKKDKKEDKRIVGGEDTTIQDRPYQLLLQRIINNEWKHACGAVILGKDVAITAGHCLLFGDKTLFQIVSGDTARGHGVTHDIKNISIHPNLTIFGEISNDVALIQVEQPFKMSATTRAIELTDSQPTIGTMAVMSGWGKPNYDDSEIKHFEKVTLKIVNRSVCNEKNKPLGLKIGKTMLCATADNKGTCPGDDGGPFTYKGKLIGVASIGANCENMTYPSIFANVFENKKWIQDTQSKWSK